MSVVLCNRVRLERYKRKMRVARMYGVFSFYSAGGRVPTGKDTERGER